MVVSVGINFSHHPETRKPTADGGVAIAIDGELRFACAEERISRHKYDGGYRRSLAFGLQSLGLTADDIDVVGLVGFGTLAGGELPDWQEEELRSVIGPRAQIQYCNSHHAGHAWSAIGQLSVQDALVIVIDHTGSTIEQAPSGLLDDARCEQTSYFLWRDRKLTLIARNHDGFGEVGYGRFYSKVTRYVGFTSYQDAGKLMGLAPFGVSARVGDVPEAYEPVPGGESTTITNNKFSEDGIADLTEWLHANGAGADYLEAWPVGKVTTEGADLAAWAQRSLETSVLRQAEPWRGRVELGAKRLALP
jgi:carbamoyltransferase